MEHVSYTHDGQSFPLQDVSYVLPRSARVALVGRNGAGKSTLLHLLAGRLSTANGKISIPRGVRLALVEQDPPYDNDNGKNLTVEDVLLGLGGPANTASTSSYSSSSVAASSSLGASRAWAAVRQYRAAVRQEEGGGSDSQALMQATAVMEATEGSWHALTKAEEVAHKLRVWHLRSSPVINLSGGERKRLSLAAALAQEPDVLLLDEPTNFLSLAGVQWLSDYLQQERKLTLLMVTHDRAFLDEVCDRILELDHGQVYETLGSYTDYLHAKEERSAIRDAALQSAQAKYRVELEWMRRQPQARATKSKSRIDAFYKLVQATRPRPRDPQLELVPGDARRLGSQILSVKNGNLQFGPDKVILKDFTYDFCKGDRICLAGANGVGKTTFVNVLTGAQPLDSGIVERGETIVLGVYDQRGLTLDDPDQTVLNFVVERVRESNTDEALSVNEARKLLTNFEFPRERWSDRVSVLSGGERRRLQMLAVFSQSPNFLLMDEPSVDCDLDTLQALERYLQEFDGVLAIVSHDRAFADKVTDHLFIFEGHGEVKDFIGSLSEYASALVEIENESVTTVASAASSTLVATTEHDKKGSYKDDKARRNEVRNFARQAKKDMDRLEKEIDRLKDASAKLEEEIDASANKGWSVIAELTEALNARNRDIDEKETQWMELAERLEAAEVDA